MQNIKHGWFSKEHSERLNSVVYSTPDGTKVEVTAVSKEKEYPGYMWYDKVYVGEVVEFLYESSGPNPFKSVNKEKKIF